MKDVRHVVRIVSAVPRTASADGKEVSPLRRIGEMKVGAVVEEFGALGSAALRRMSLLHLFPFSTTNGKGLLKVTDRTFIESELFGTAAGVDSFLSTMPGTAFRFMDKERAEALILGGFDHKLRQLDISSFYVFDNEANGSPLVHYIRSGDGPWSIYTLGAKEAEGRIGVIMMYHGISEKK